ncbi:MAG: response regulator [Fuerstiella sp.]
MTNIIVVDDSTTDRIRIAGLLRLRSDWKIQTAASATEAMDNIRRQPVDLVLTDLQMPEINGLELLETLSHEFPSIPVVVITGMGSEELAVQTMKSGAAQYVCKTDPPSLIRDSIDKVLLAKADLAIHQSVLRRMLSDSYYFELQSDTSIMSGMSRFLGGKAGAIGICTEAELPRLVIAMEEALLNACLHGNLELESTLKEEDDSKFEALAAERSAASPWKDRIITVDARFSPHQMIVKIKDEGSGFDPLKLPNPTDPENLLKPHGRGVMMMKLFLDEVKWNESGNEVTLLKKGPAS